MTKAYSRPYRLAYQEDDKLVPPQQELFLEVETRDGIGEVYLDEISDMSDKVLSGFVQYLTGKHISLSAEADMYGVREVEGKKVTNTAIFFKKRIYGVFLHHAKSEQKERRTAKWEWIRRYEEKQNGNEPCQWLDEFNLPTTYSGVKAQHQKSKDYSGALLRFIRGVKRAIGDSHCNTLLETSGLALDDEYSFMLYVNSMNGTARVALME